MSYGALPKVVGHIDLNPTEVMYYLYLPVSLPGMREMRLPRQLDFLYPLLAMVQADEPERFAAEHVYLTVKRMFVGGGVTPNRPGWHADGFLTDDLNYVWYDCVPTVFNESEFTISADHTRSLEEFAAQARPERNVTYPPRLLLKLDSKVVHAVGEPSHQQMRLFVKVSISKDRYNLKDNSRNYELDYRWPMHDRATVRNCPATAQRDSVPSNPKDDHFA